MVSGKLPGLSTGQIYYQIDSNRLNLKLTITLVLATDV